MIKNIVFDMGNVLFDFKPSEYIRRLGYTGQDAELLETEVFKTAEWCAMDRGSLKPAQAAQLLAQHVPAHLQAAVEPLICHWWEGDLMPTPGIGDLIRELKAGGYGIYLLSNASRVCPRLIALTACWSLPTGCWPSPSMRSMKSCTPALT